MSSTYETGFKTTLAIELLPTDVEVTIATAPSITNGRIFLDN